ncbi:MAG: winged helix DNA-binding domain-containing protein [Micromonosporaceae bacterium]
MRHIDTAERRARLLRRHHLVSGHRAADPAQAAAGVVVLHATDPASVHLQVLARLREPDISAVERALYEERELVRMLGMRRTMFVAPVGFAPVVQAAAARAVAVRERRRLVQRITPAVRELGAAGVEAWLADVQESTLGALRARGEATAAELSADEPRLRTQVLMAEGKKYEAWTNITTWVLNQLSVEGRIVRGRPRGTWISSQYRWSPLERWLPGGLPDLPAADARAALIRAWLERFGPGTVADIKWWTGFTLAEVHAALTAIAPADVDLGGTPGLLLADDLDPVPPPDEPEVALLPALDPTPMGWQQRDWYLGVHKESLFDRNGNIGPTIWWEGRIVGGWAQRGDGELAYRLREDIGADGVAAVEKALAQLAALIGPVRFVPRFRTPLERDLAG